MTPERKEILKLSCYGSLMFFLFIGLSSFILTLLVIDTPLSELAHLKDSGYSTILPQSQIDESSHPCPTLQRRWVNVTTTHTISSSSTPGASLTILAVHPTKTLSPQLHTPPNATSGGRLFMLNSSSRLQNLQTSTIHTSTAMLNAGSSSKSTSQASVFTSTGKIFIPSIQASNGTAHVEYTTIILATVSVPKISIPVPGLTSLSVSAHSTLITRPGQAPISATSRPPDSSSRAAASQLTSEAIHSNVPPTNSPIHTSGTIDTLPQITNSLTFSITTSTANMITTIVRQIDQTIPTEVPFPTTLTTDQSLSESTTVSSDPTSVTHTQSSSPTLNSASSSSSKTAITPSSPSQKPTLTPTFEPAWVSQKPQNSPLSNGQILGICIGIILFVFILMVLSFYLFPRLKRKLKRRVKDRNSYFGDRTRDIEMSSHPQHSRGPSIGSANTGRSLLHRPSSAAQSSIVDLEDRIGENGWDCQLTPHKIYNVGTCICSRCWKEKQKKEDEEQLREAIDHWRMAQYPSQAHLRRCDHDWISTGQRSAGQPSLSSIPTHVSASQTQTSERPISQQPRGMPLSRPVSAYKSLPPPNPMTFWEDLAIKKKTGDSGKAVSSGSNAGSVQEVELSHGPASYHSAHDTLLLTKLNIFEDGTETRGGGLKNSKLMCQRRGGNKSGKDIAEDPKVAEVRRAVERVLGGKHGEAGGGECVRRGEGKIVCEGVRGGIPGIWEEETSHASPLRERQSMYCMQ